MVIKGTNKIKGVLDLSSVGLQFKEGATFSISDKNYWNSDVQAALKMGYIVSAGDPTKGGSDDAPKVVRCVNSYHRALTLKALGDKEIMPNHSFTMPESKMNNPDIKAAINKGMITVTQIINTSDYSEGFLEIGSLFEKESAKKKERDKKEAEAFKNKQKQIELETNESLSSLGEVVEDNPKQDVVWNPKSKQPVNSIKNAVRTSAVDAGDKTDTLVPENVIDTANPDPVQAKDINKNSVVVNPAGVQITNTAKHAYAHDPAGNKKMGANVIDTENPDPVQAPELMNKAKIANPGGNPITNTAKQSVVWNPAQAPLYHSPKSGDTEITFADEKAEKERLAKHPKLKDQTVKQDDDDPMAPDPSAERIRNHPVLSKKVIQNDEIDFLD